MDWPVPRRTDEMHIATMWRMARLKESSSAGSNLSHAEATAATSDYVQLIRADYLPQFGYSDRQLTSEF